MLATTAAVATVGLLAASGSATAASDRWWNDNTEIANQSIGARDIGRGAVGQSELRHGAVGLHNLNRAVKQRRRQIARLAAKNERYADVLGKRTEAADDMLASLDGRMRQVEAAQEQQPATGPQGPQGEQGSQGPQGEPGVSGYQHQRSALSVPDGKAAWTTVSCPAGKVAVGGGVEQISLTDDPDNPGTWSGAAYHVMQSYPHGDGWFAEVRFDDGDDTQAGSALFVVHVICAGA